jgi:hypothetical protein
MVSVVLSIVVAHDDRKTTLVISTKLREKYFIVGGSDA